MQASAVDEQSSQIVPALPLRLPHEVMRLARLGAFFPHRLSFMRCLIRRLCAEKATMRVTARALDANGFGHVVLRIQLGDRAYSLIGYSRALDPLERTDRVIATKWDASFCLFDGIPGIKDIARLERQVARQEAGRYDERVLILSRANKSVRLFEHVVEALSRGEQPALERLSANGYLMRTTAVYGNGKFGIADYDKVAAEAIGGPFQAELLTVFLIREFTFVLVEWLAKQKSTRAVALCPAYRRYLGIGNATGLGMAPFLVNHPCLVHSWIHARETALARVRALPAATLEQRARFPALLDRAQRHIAEWQVSDALQAQRIATLKKELAQFQEMLLTQPLAAYQPYDAAFRRTADMSHEMQELLVSVLIEIGPGVVDELAESMANPCLPRLEPAMRLGALRDLLDAHYSWACGVDLSDRAAQAQFWYVSAEKLEPRVGLRYQEPGAELEMPFPIPRYIQQLSQALDGQPDAMRVAEFLLAHPEHRHIIRRVQTIQRFPYGEIRDNLVAQGCRPIDLLRCKLSFFGAAKFDPKSAKWTRITLYQGAPTAAELTRQDADDWLFAVRPPPPTAN